MGAPKVYNGSVWVPASMRVYDGSAHEGRGKYWDGSAWKELFELPEFGPAVSANADGDSNLRLNNPCYAGVQFQSSGSEYEYTATGGTTFVNVWLDAGGSDEVWVERIVTVGSWNSLDPGTGRHQLSTTRSFRVIRTSVGSHTVTGYFKFWDAASGGNLLQQTASASYVANYEDFS